VVLPPVVLVAVAAAARLVLAERPARAVAAETRTQASAATPSLRPVVPREAEAPADLAVRQDPAERPGPVARLVLAARPDRAAPRSQGEAAVARLGNQALAAPQALLAAHRAAEGTELLEPLVAPPLTAVATRATVARPWVVVAPVVAASAISGEVPSRHRPFLPCS
jgi:hypothetical protein